MIINTDLIYPIGAIYISTVSTNPGILFGGIWEAINSRFLIGTGTATGEGGETYNFVAGSAGGEYSHQLKQAEIPNFSGSFSTTVPGNHNNYASGIFSGDSSTWSGQTLVSNQQSGSNMWGYKANFGGNGYHNNLPPFYVVYMWRRVS